MESPQWHPIPGAHSAEVYPYLLKPSVFSCNSFLIRTPQSLAVIDPGGLPEQTEALIGLIRDELKAEPRPIHVLLTHCHADHSLEIARGGSWRELPDLKTIIHARGADALRVADREITQAEILGCALPPFTPDIALFSSPPDPSGAGASCRRETIPLSTRDALEAYPVPGHSPDAVCYRLGGAIFVGDLLAAVSPLIAGVPGWDRESLIASMQRILRFLEAENVLVAFPGHGPPLHREQIKAALQRSLQEAVSLAGIETADAGRMRYISGYAQDLFEELGTVFMRIHGKIDRLSDRLHNLEEWSAATDIAGILASEQVCCLLTDFRNFQESFQSGKVVEVQVALKAAQLVRKIAGLLDYARLGEIIDPALLHLAKTLLNDFLAACRGIRTAEEEQEVDLNELAATLAREMGRPHGAARSLAEIPDDPDGFRGYLIRTLAEGSAVRDLEVKVESATAASPVRARRERLRSGLKLLLEELAEEGAKSVAFAVPTGEGRPALSLRVEFARPIYRLGDQHFKPHRRRLGLAGARLTVRYSSRALDCILEF